MAKSASSDEYNNITTRSSIGIRTRSGKKAFNTVSLLARHRKCLLNKNSPKISAKSSPAKSNLKNSKKAKVQEKVYKKQLSTRIEQRKQEFALKRASSRIAAFYCITEDQIARRADLFKQLYKADRTKLEANLKDNGQKCDGSKKALALRISEGVMFGAVPKCSKCEAGHLEFDFNTGNYNCEGYLDEFKNQVFCSGEFTFAQMINKVSDWKY